MSLNPIDLEYLSQNLNTSGLLGSDSALGNVFLLQPKYNTELKIQNNILIRKYFGTENRFGYAFPLPLSNPPAGDYLSQAISYIFQQNLDKTDIHFCLCTQDQKNELDACLRQNFPTFKINWKTTRDDCDYIYLQEKLASLSGSALQKKKNHISQFLRKYEGEWEYKSFPEFDIADDILAVEENWFNERSNDIEKAFDSAALSLEKESIKVALENAALLKLTGGVLYLNGKPAAMTLASPISENTLDVHFEKALSFAAMNGAYAVINNLFVKTCTNYKYINREEDMGVEGLRKAKLSYKPEILLDKFYGMVEKC